MKLPLGSACAVVAVGVVVACGNGGTAASFDSTSEADGGSAATPATCAAGATASCTCDDGAVGTETCDDAGVYAACACGAGLTPPPAADASAPAVCGDGVCATSETCEACPTDCGQCPSCGLAPSCSVGVALPSQPTTLDFNALSAPMPAPDGGALTSAPDGTCGGPQLRLRISRIEVQHQHQEVWLPTGTLDGPSESYYCLVQASDGLLLSGSGPDAGTNGTLEVALTTPTAQIADYGGADFAPSDSIFWGQAGPRLTQGNLTVTYSCFQQKSSGSATWSNVLQAGASAAGSLASSGPYGWAFGLGSVGLSVAAAAASAAESQGDWHMFDVTQTIDASWFMDLTNGRTWSFTQSGGDAAFQYPWGMTVYVESWGCADAVAANP